MKIFSRALFILASAPVALAQTTSPAPSQTATPGLVNVDGNHAWFLGLIIASFVAGILAAIILKPGRNTSKHYATERDDNFFRNQIAQQVLGWCMGILLALASAAIFVSSIPNAGTTAKDVFNAVLPVLGTWVGTLLTFYFARENFKAAQESKANDSATPEKLVRELMFAPPFPMLEKNLAEQGDKAKLKEILAFFNKRSATTGLFAPTRVFIPRAYAGNDVRFARFILSKEIIELYFKALSLAKKDGEPDPDPTLEDLVTDERFRQTLNDISYGTVEADASPARARSVLQNLTTTVALSGSDSTHYRCRDILVTESGGAKSPVLGWITEETLSRA
jgi:hypothetical protein